MGRSRVHCEIDFDVSSESRLREPRSAALSQVKAEGFECHSTCHSFYKVHGETENLKVLTFVETVTAMSGAIMVPDLSANQVEIEALKKLIAVNGFTKSVFKHFKNQLVMTRHYPLKSVPYSHQSQDTVARFHKTLYGQVRAIRIRSTRTSLWSSRRGTSSLDTSTCSLSDQSLPSQIRWKNIIRKGVQQTSEVTHSSRRRARSRSHSISTPFSKIADQVSTWGVIRIWLGKDLVTGVHIVSLIDGQILKTRTITCLIRENQFSVEEFKKFKVATHESSVHYKEDSYDHMFSRI